MLNLTKDVILGNSNGRVTNIYFCTTFDANIWNMLIGDRDMAEKSNPKNVVDRHPNYTKICDFGRK